MMRALVLTVFLAGCSFTQPRVDSVEDAIAYTASGITSAATLVRELCRNTEPGGECAPDANISTSTKERVKQQLQNALNYLALANSTLVEGGNPEDQLATAEAILRAVRDELSRYSQ